MQKYLIIFLVLILMVGGANAQDSTVGSPDRIYVNEVDSTAFPQVSIDFRVVDSQGRGVALNRNSISITEDGTPINDFSLEQTSESPLNVFFVLNRGDYLPGGHIGNDIRASMSLLANSGVMREGLDSVALISASPQGVTTNLPLTLASASMSDFTSAVSQVSITDDFGETDSVAAVRTALDQIINNDLHRTGSAVIVFIGRNVNNDGTTLEQATQRARNNGIPIYAIHTSVSNDQNERTNMQALANQSGGSYVLIDGRGSSSIVSTEVYAPISIGRERYRVVYQSNNITGTGNREVSLSVSGTSLRAQETYRTDGMQPPQVVIDSPAPNAVIDRLVDTNLELEQLSFGVSSATVATSVTWPDGSARDITEAVLIVTENGAEVNRIAIDPSSNSTFDFTWDISNIQSDGANARVLQVEVTDDLGLSATSPTVNVTVPLVIPEDLTIIQETFVQTACEADSGSMECRMELLRTYAPYVGFAFAVGIAFYYRRQASHVVVGSARAAGTLVTGIGTGIRNTLIGGSSIVGDPGISLQEPFGVLEVEEGPEAIVTGRSVGKHIDLLNRSTTIGRSPEHSNIVFYGLDVDSTVSRLHCTLRYDDQGPSFYITDEKSATGTKVDGQRIPPNTPTKLRNGSVIEIGKARKWGVLLKFTSEKLTPSYDDFQVKPNAAKSVGTEVYGGMQPAIKSTMVVGGDEDFPVTPKAEPKPEQNGNVTRVPVEQNGHSDTASIRPERPNRGRKDKDWMDDL